MITLFNKKGKQYLTPIKLNEEIKFFHKKKLKRQFLEDKKLVIDLSKIQWVNLTALVELILNIENWLKEDINVFFKLPFVTESYINDSNFSNPFKLYIYKRRKKVRDWLFEMNIKEALSFSHLDDEYRKRFLLIDEIEDGVFRGEENYENTEVRDNLNMDVLDKALLKIPLLLWINFNNIEPQEFVNRLSDSFQKAGIDKELSKNVSERILLEFLNNTKDHSKKRICLLGISNNPFFNKQPDYYNIDKKSLNHFEHPMFAGKNYFFDEFLYYKDIFNRESVLEIAFGDNGIGIAKSLRENEEYEHLKNNEILKLSFDRFSSKTKYINEKEYLERGTRGLYNVKRILSRYDGFIAIRSYDDYVGHNELAGNEINNKVNPSDDFINELNINNQNLKYNFQSNKIKSQNKLYNFKGTLITVKILNDRKNNLSYKFFNSKNISCENTVSVRIIVDIENYEKSLVKIAKLSKENNETVFLISINEFKLNNDNINEFKIEIKNFLVELSELRHPNIYIVYGFPLVPNEFSDDSFYEELERDIENYIDKFISEKSYQNDPRWYFDPVLVISPKGNMYWVGTKNIEQNSFLKELSLNPRKIKDVITNNPNILDLIKSDKELFIYNNENGTISLNIDKNAPINELKKVIDYEINEIDKRYTTNKKITITPNLIFTKGWFPNKKIFDNLNETVFALYSLWIENRIDILKKHFVNSFDSEVSNKIIDDSDIENLQTQLLSKSIKILVESETDKNLGLKLLKLLDISQSHNNLKVLVDENDVKKPRRIELFDSTDYVIILCSIVSSGETLTNMIKTVLRSNATPLVAFSLLDISENIKTTCSSKAHSSEQINKIKVWEKEILYYNKFKNDSLIITHEDLIGTSEKEYKFINPNGKLLADNLDPDKFRIQEPLRQMIIHSKSLHFNHFGKTNGRHFTFYFNAHRFLDSKNYSNAFLKELDRNFYGDFDMLIWEVFIKEKFEKAFLHIDDLESSIIWYPDSDYLKGYQKQGEDLSLIIQKGIKEVYKFKIPAKPIPRDGVSKISKNSFKNIFIVDWGSITSETLEKLMLKAHQSFVDSIDSYKELINYKDISVDIARFFSIPVENARVYEIENNIIICVFLNQLTTTKSKYLNSISKLKTHKPINYQPESLKQSNIIIQQEFNFNQDISPYDVPVSIPIDFVSNIQLVFINDFPLTCFESEYECNICATIKDLNDYSFPGTELFNFLKKRSSILHIQPREETLKEPSDPYSNEDNPILFESSFIMDMFEFKHLLILAQEITYYRFIVKKKLILLLKSIIKIPNLNKFYDEENENINLIFDRSNKIVNCNTHLKHDEEYSSIDIYDPISKISSLIYFLSVETSWVQKHPLVLKECREILSLISQLIIFNKNLVIINELENKNIDIIRLKYAAITLLRIADKSSFINRSIDIVSISGSQNYCSNSILENFLFHTNTFISKEYHSSHNEIKPFLSRIEKLEEILNNFKTELPYKEALWNLQEKTYRLDINGDFRRLTKSRIVDSCLSGLSQGFKQYQEKGKHIQFATSFYALNIKNIKYFDNEAKERFKSNCIANWGYVSNFIGNIINNHLRLIDSILLSKWAKNNFGMDRLMKYVYNYNFGKNDEFSLLFQELIQSDFKLINDETFLSKYNLLYEDIGHCFIWHPNNKSGEKSILYQVLSQLKSNIFTSLNSLKNKSFLSKIDIIYEGNINIDVLYAIDLMDNFIFEILTNTEERQLQNRKAQIKISVLFEDANYIIVNFIFINTINGNIKEGGGKGLLLTEEHLPLFDGSFKKSDESNNFNLTLKFLKYE